MKDIFINEANIQKFADYFGLSKDEVEVIRKKIYVQKFLDAVHDTVCEEAKEGE